MNMILNILDELGAKQLMCEYIYIETLYNVCFYNSD